MCGPGLQSGGPGPQDPAHESMNLIKPGSPKLRSTARIENTAGVSLLLFMAIGFEMDGGEHLDGQGQRHGG
jgi:hypothetical protein